MSQSSLDLTRQYTSFGGVDIRVILAGSLVGEMQAISYAIQREKAPIYVMGRVDPLSFSRGKRGIAGTMISLLLDQHLIKRVGAFATSQFIADNDEIFPSQADLNLRQEDFVAGNDLGIAGDIPKLDDDGVIIPPEEPAEGGSKLSDMFTPAAPWYVDQILPFDVTIVAANEYGKSAKMVIYGVEILNEGSGFSIDDIVIESQMTYVCRTILPWQPLGHWKVEGTKGTFGAFELGAEA